MKKRLALSLFAISFAVLFVIGFKSHFSNMFFDFSPVAHAQTSCTAGNITCDLVAWYKFDDGSGATTTDSSNTGNNGTFIGTPTWVSGNIGTGAAQFNGSSYVTIPSNASTSFSTSIPFSISMWVKTTASSGMLVEGGFNPNYIIGYNYNNISGVYAQLDFASGGLCILNTATSSMITDGQWHHIVVVVNRNSSCTTNDVVIYVDDTRQPTGVFNLGGTNQNLTSSDPIILGGRNGGSGTFLGTFTGAFDDFRVYNRELTAPDVLALYQLASTSYQANTNICTNTSSCVANSCSESDVENAIGQVVDGATVTIPAGICTWSTLFDLTRPMTLSGIGTSSTYIIDGIDKSNQYITHHVISLDVLSDAYETRLTNFTLGSSTQSDPFNESMMSVNIMGNNWRIDHMLFNATGTSAMTVTSNGGVIDHNEFDLYSVEGVIGDALSTDHEGDIAWTQGADFGSSTAPYFIEDNVFRQMTSNGFAVGATDGFRGQRTVFRHNTLYNATWFDHGLDSGGDSRGPRSEEIYDNNFNFTSDISGGSAGIYFRSASALVFGNTFTGAASIVQISTANYRDFAGYSDQLGACDGSSLYDEDDGVIYTAGTATMASTTASQFIVMTDSTANWTPGQWVGYSLFNLNQGGDGSFIESNSSTTISVLSSSGHHRIAGNIIAEMSFNVGDHYQILRASACLDQMGRGAGQLITNGGVGDVPDNNSWLQEVPEQTYTWGNTWNGSPIGMITNAGGLRQYEHVFEYKDFYNDRCPAGYVPYTYPHPLTGATAQSQPLNCPGSPPTPTYSIFITKSGTGLGSIGGSTMDCGTTYTTSCSATGLISGDTAILTAAPSSIATFGGWGGACSSYGMSPTCTLTIGSSNVSASAVFNATTTDTTPPSVPRDLTLASNTSSSVSFVWSPSSDNAGVEGYNIYRNGSFLASTTSLGPTTNITYTDPTVSASTTYSYTVSAYNTFDLESTQTYPLSVTTPITSTPDTTSPVVTAFTIPGTASSLTISITSFTATDDVYVTGYMVTESSIAPSSSASGWTSSAPTAYTFGSAGSKTLYAWAKDAAGNVSASLSAPITVTVSTSGNTSSGCGSCGSGGGGGGGTPPAVLSVSLTSPVNRTTYGLNVPIPLMATAEDAAKVDFLIATATPTVSGATTTLWTSTSTLLRTVASSPYTYTWPGSKAGIYVITARATDAYNNPMTSLPVIIGISAIVPTSTILIAPTQPQVVPIQTVPGCPTGLVCTPNQNTPAPDLDSPIPCSSSFVFTRSLTLGSTGSDVKALQQFLNDNGFTIAPSGNGSPGHETTYFGPATQSALERYQKANGIAPSSGYFGSITRAFVTKSYSCSAQTTPITQTPSVVPTANEISAPQTPSGAFTTPLKLGSTGSEVKELQIFLNTHGYIIAFSGNGSPGNETTYYGPATAAAVSRFQVAHASEILTPYGLTGGTGNFGAATMRVVNSI